VETNMEKKSDSQIADHREEFKRSTTKRLEVCEAKINERIDRVEDFKNELKEFYNQNNRDEKELLEKVSMFVDKLTHIREKKVSPLIKENEYESLYPDPEHMENVGKIMPCFEGASDRKVRRIIKALSESCDVEIPDNLERRLDAIGAGSLKIQKLLESDKEIISRRLEQNSELRHKFSGSKELVKYVDEEKNLLEQYEFRRSEILNFANFLERISKPDELSHSKKALKFIYVAERERLWNELMTNTKYIGSELPDLALSETQKVSPPGKNLRKTAVGVGAGGLVGLAAGLTGHLDPLASATIFATGTGTAIKLLVDSYALNASQFDVDSLLQKASEVLKTASKARLDWNATRLYTKAIKFANEIIRLNPEELEAFNIKGIAQTNLGSLLKDTDRFDDALESFDTVIESHEDPLVLYNKAKALCSKAAFEDRENCLQQAESVIGRAIELDNKNSEHYELRGDIYQQLKNLNQALVDYERAIDLGGETKLSSWEKFHSSWYANIRDTKSPPRMANHLHGKKAAVLWKLGKLEESKKVLKDAFGLKDGTLEYALELRNNGDRFASQNKLIQARHYFEKAVKVEPDLYSCMKLAETNYRLGSFAEAIKYVELARNIYPKFITEKNSVFGSKRLAKAIIENDGDYIDDWIAGKNEAIFQAVSYRLKCYDRDLSAESLLGFAKANEFVSRLYEGYRLVDTIDNKKLPVYRASPKVSLMQDIDSIKEILNEEPLDYSVRDLEFDEEEEGTEFECPLCEATANGTDVKCPECGAEFEKAEEEEEEAEEAEEELPMPSYAPGLETHAKPVAKVKCSACAEVIPIYSTERPLRVECPECHRQGTLKSPEQIAKSDNPALDRLMEEQGLVGMKKRPGDRSNPALDRLKKEYGLTDESTAYVPPPPPPTSVYKQASMSGTVPGPSNPDAQVAVPPAGMQPGRIRPDVDKEIKKRYERRVDNWKSEGFDTSSLEALLADAEDLKTVKFEFDKFRRKVYRLKDIEVELLLYSKKGVDNIIEKIKSDLKDVNKLETIEEYLGQLKERIYGKEKDPNAKPSGHSFEQKVTTSTQPADMRPAVPSSPDINTLYLQSKELLTNDKLEDALSTLDNVLATSPDHADAWRTKGSVLEKLGRNEDAIKAYNRAVQLVPSNESYVQDREVVREKIRALRGEEAATAESQPDSKRVVARKYVKKYLRVDIPQNVEGHAKKVGDEIYAKAAIASGDTWYKINSQGQIVNERGELVEEGRSVGISSGNRDSLKKFYEQARNFVTKELSDLVWVPVPESAEPSAAKERASELEIPEPVAASPLQRTLKDNNNRNDTNDNKQRARDKRNSTRNQLPENVELTAPYTLPDNVELAKPEVTRDGRAALDEYTPGSDQLIAKLAARQLLYDFNCGRWGELYLNDLKVECGKLEGNLNTTLAESKAQELAKKWGQDFIKRKKLSGTYANICVSLFVEYGVTAVKSLSDIRNIKSLQPNRYLSADRIQEILHNPPMQIIDLEQEVLRR